MRCQHCSSIFGRIEQLQDHQAASCPGIISDSEKSFVFSDKEDDSGKFDYLQTVGSEIAHY